MIYVYPANQNQIDQIRTMQTTFYLVFSKDGVEKMNKSRKPALKSGQRGVRMRTKIPDAFFEQPFPEIEVEFDKGDLAKPSVSVRVEETKDRLCNQFQRLFEELPENRQEYIRDEVWEQSREVWSLFWNDKEEKVKNLVKEDVQVSELAKALEWVLEQAEQRPDLPPEYRAENFEEQFGRTPSD